MSRVLIMAGGTGGHVFPALAVAKILIAQGVDVQWMGTRAGLEADVVPRAGIPISFIAVSGLRGKGWLSWLLAPSRLIVALWQSLILIKRLSPGVVLGMGGFVTGPGGLSAWLLDKHLVIHEQNAVAGLTNRLLAPLASKVLVAFPDSLSTRRKQHTGNPVRAEIAALAPPQERMHGRSGPLRLLVLGGSLGAQIFNDEVPKGLQGLSPAERPEVWHQSGVRNIEVARRHYLEAGVTARLEPFISDMAAAYAWADLVLCRAGALTVAELACAGVASILIPYPHAVDDHQTYNARYLAEAGAAMLVPQPSFKAAFLIDFLRNLGQTRTRLLAMAIAARKRALPQAATQVAEICKEVSHG